MNRYDILHYSSFIISLILIGLAIYLYQKTNRLIKNGIKTDATVVDLIEKRDSEGKTLFTPIFKYKDKNDNDYRWEYNVSSNPAAYDVGEKVTIIYNPLDPTNRKLVSYWGLFSIIIIILCIASVFFVIGFGYILYNHYSSTQITNL